MNCSQKNLWVIGGIFFVLFFQFVFMPFANSRGVETLVEQLNLLNMADSTNYSTVGMITFFYLPEPNGYFINVTARDKTEQPQWVVRNLYIPDNSWISKVQNLSTRFCLQMLGYFPGEKVETLDMAIFIRDTVSTKMPQSEGWQAMGVDTLSDDSQGDMTKIDPKTPPLIYPRFPEFNPSEKIASLEFRGCRVPNIDLDDSTYPDTEDYAGDYNACGPASAANSLGWLDSVSKEIEIPESARTIMEELSKLMNRSRNGGVTIDQFIQGKLDFIEAHSLSINVKFQSCHLQKEVISSSGMTYARNDNAGAYPTWEWLAQQMKEGEDVEMMYYWEDGETWRGHAVVVTGIEESEDGSKKSVKFKHDVRQGRKGGTKQEDESIYIDSYGRMILRARGAFIGNVVAESPGDPFPTPVELGLFTAEVVNGDVHLSWRTETESNNYGFEIFRNDDKIAFVEGNGTTFEPQLYSYIDATVIDGDFHYDLIQIDFDGAREKIASADVTVSNQPTEFNLAQNHPNPFNATTNIGYSIPTGGLVTITLYNMLGREIATIVNEHKEVGHYTIEFDASHLVSGIYFYRMEAGGFRQIRKFVLLK